MRARPHVSPEEGETRRFQDRYLGGRRTDVPMARGSPDGCPYGSGVAGRMSLWLGGHRPCGVPLHRAAGPDRRGGRRGGVKTGHDNVACARACCGCLLSSFVRSVSMLNRRGFIAAAAGLPALAMAVPGARAARLDPAMIADLKNLPVLRGPVTDASFDGRPLLVTFFASWCPPCRAEMGELSGYIEKNGNRVSMVAANWTESFAGPVSQSRLRRFVDVIHPDIGCWPSWPPPGRGRSPMPGADA